LLISKSIGKFEKYFLYGHEFVVRVLKLHRVAGALTWCANSAAAWPLAARAEQAEKLPRTTLSISVTGFLQASPREGSE
jgi:hypothetical protein